MRATRARSLALLLVTTLLLSACGEGSASSARASESPRGAPAALPASLDALFPPRAERPRFLLAMIELGTALDGLVADLLEQDLENARAGLARLQRAYAECRDLVPEWAHRYPSSPVDALQAALDRPDAGAALGAIEALGAACASCHHASMVAVQQHYHWGDFAGIRVTDPLAHEEITFGALMHRLATNLAGITTDLAQGQGEGARRHLAGLRARYETLEESCGACHASERAYYVGADVERVWDGLQAELAREEPDADAVTRLVGSLGERSCHRCHLVHVPAAFAGRARPVH